MQCIYLCFFSISLFIESENSSVIKSWSPYVTLLNYFATFPLIWFLNSSQQTAIIVESGSPFKESKCLKRKWERTSNISWDMNCFKTWLGFFIRLKIPWENSKNTVKNFLFLLFHLQKVNVFIRQLYLSPWKNYITNSKCFYILCLFIMVLMIQKNVLILRFKRHFEKTYHSLYVNIKWFGKTCLSCKVIYFVNT